MKQGGTDELAFTSVCYALWLLDSEQTFFRLSFVSVS